MKKLLSVALTMSFLAACGPANEDYSQRLKAANNKGNATQGDTSAGGETTTSGDEKQPEIKATSDSPASVAEDVGLGKVIVDGIAVARQGSQFVLDTRISTKNKSELSDVASGGKNDAAKASKKFINLGCPDLTDADTADLEEINMPTEASKDIVMVSAAKIFVCGQQKLAMSLATITSDELILKGAQIEAVGTLVNLIFTTNSLEIQGDNLVAGQGTADSKTPPTLQLTVHEQLRGSGKLALKTVDGIPATNSEAATHLPDTLEEK